MPRPLVAHSLQREHSSIDFMLTLKRVSYGRRLKHCPTKKKSNFRDPISRTLPHEGAETIF